MLFSLTWNINDWYGITLCQERIWLHFLWTLLTHIYTINHKLIWNAWSFYAMEVMRERERGFNATQQSIRRAKRNSNRYISTTWAITLKVNSGEIRHIHNVTRLNGDLKWQTKTFVLPSAHHYTRGLTNIILITNSNCTLIKWSKIIDTILYKRYIICTFKVLMNWHIVNELQTSVN